MESHTLLVSPLFKGRVSLSPDIFAFSPCVCRMSFPPTIHDRPFPLSLKKKFPSQLLWSFISPLFREWVSLSPVSPLFEGLDSLSTRYGRLFPLCLDVGFPSHLLHSSVPPLFKGWVSLPPFMIACFPSVCRMGFPPTCYDRLFPLASNKPSWDLFWIANWRRTFMVQIT